MPVYVARMKKIIGVVSLVSLINCHLAASVRASDSDASASASTAQPLLIAQACTTCGAEISSQATVGSLALGKQKDHALLTDSLWGNLILEMAYQRDKELSLLMRKMGLLNTGTLLAIGGIAAGTLAQGVTALATLNPPNGAPDSYVPGSLGVAFSCATIVTFGARTYFGHQYQKHIQQRQLELKAQTEAVLSHLEHSNGTCPQAKDQLRTLIGERASNEWLQLWRSSHQLASEKQPTITSLPPDRHDLKQMLSAAAQTQATPPLNLADKAQMYVLQQCTNSHPALSQAKGNDAAEPSSGSTAECSALPAVPSRVDGIVAVPDLVH